MRQRKIGELVKDTLFFTAGSAIFAVGVNCFTAPNQIAPGGVTGIATMMNYLWGTPIGLFILLLNIPILFWGIWEIGWRLIAKTMLAVVFSSAAVDIFAYLLPAYQGNDMLAAVFGGVLEGIGLSLVFMRGATTGGVDMIARLLGKRLRHISMGKLMFGVDFVIITVSAFVYGKIESALYALIAIFVSTKIIDALLYGTDTGTGKMYFIISQKSKEIAQRIIHDLQRGVTLIDSYGGYSQEPNITILCAVRRHEVYRINSIIHEIDKNAFVIVGEAGEISGEGFKEHVSNDKTLRELLSGVKK